MISHCGLICISLMISDIEHLFTTVGHLNFPLRKTPIQVFCLFLNQFFVCLFVFLMHVFISFFLYLFFTLQYCIGFAIHKHESVYFFMLNCMSCLYILDRNPLLVTSFANIFSYSVGYFFML